MPRHDPKHCGFCGGCSGACPQNVITVFESSLSIDLKGCTGCGTCALICPSGAMRKGGGKGA